MKTKSCAILIPALTALLPVVLLLGILSCKTGPVPDAKHGNLSGTSAVLQKIAERLGQGDYDGALALFDRIDPADAEKSGIRLLKASTLLSAGKTRDARTLTEAVLAGETGNIQAMLVMASVEEASGREKEQKVLLDRVLKVEPANTAALVSMGNIASRNSSFWTAASFYDKALAAEPGNGEALLGRAWVYRNSREPKKAEEALNQAVNLHPRWAAALQERGRFYRAQGFPQRALEDLDRAKALEPDNYWIACDRGGALVDLNRKPEALTEFERAVRLNPGHFLAYVYSAGIKDELGDYDGAVKAYESLARLNPDYYFAFEGLGVHSMRRGNWLAARDAFMEAYKRARDDEGSYGLLAAMNWMRAGKPQDPRQFLEDVMRKVKRDSLEYWMIRLYHDLVGDADMVIKLDKEKDSVLKARMLYYLASYYDIRGNKNLADRYFLQVREMNIKNFPEWRLNEWALEARGLARN
ncbi:MAG: tetratricopeptide repeat protein [Treponema sp.]|jgi:tetratricopeptide (TPR) repeat protein|nr:tetratricopeptide repeat protein [Treponema sp.]